MHPVDHVDSRTLFPLDDALCLERACFECNARSQGGRSDPWCFSALSLLLLLTRVLAELLFRRRAQRMCECTNRGRLDTVSVGCCCRSSFGECNRWAGRAGVVIEIEQAAVPDQHHEPECMEVKSVMSAAGRLFCVRRCFRTIGLDYPLCC
ncbi:unnamed protein product [Ectocarpus sp. 12 AP-2014]